MSPADRAGDRASAIPIQSPRRCGERRGAGWGARSGIASRQRLRTIASGVKTLPCSGIEQGRRPRRTAQASRSWRVSPTGRAQPRLARNAERTASAAAGVASCAGGPGAAPAGAGRGNAGEPDLGGEAAAETLGRRGLSVRSTGRDRDGRGGGRTSSRIIAGGPVATGPAGRASQDSTTRCSAREAPAINHDLRLNPTRIAARPPTLA